VLIKALRAWSPWAPGEGLQWGVFLVLGHGLCLVAWWLASREAGFDHQAGWAALAVGGFVVVAYGDVSWLLRARWAVMQRRRRLLPDAVDFPVSVSVPVGGGVVVGEGLVHFHRPDCPLAAGKGWRSVDREAALVDGRRECGMCEP
jgi:hypothetical protein